MRDFVPGLVAILIATPIYWIVRFVRRESALSFAEVSTWVVVFGVGSVFPVILLLAAARYFHVWPFSN